MKQYTITIPDNKASSFVDMMKSITYVKNIEDNTEIDIPEEHKNIVRERIKKSDQDPSRRFNWDEVKHKIKL
jgi:hypothetical protein